MPRKDKKPSKRQRSPSVDSASSFDSSDELELGDILHAIDKHKTWAALIRDRSLFEVGLFELSLPWIKELWDTRGRIGTKSTGERAEQKPDSKST